MNAQREHKSPHRPKTLVHRLVHVLRRHTDEPSGGNPGAQRMDEPPPDWNPTVQPDAGGPKSWSEVEAAQVPKSRGDDPVQLPDSRAEPGGPPVYADPNMVSPAAAEKMRPLFRRSR
ncbi:MAG TPA: hypothetical protein VMZ00_11315 [Sporichthya sp.]|nr:hypothetical protein [Sporichthya sp.]